MIFDTLDNLPLYFKLHPELCKVRNFLKRNDPADLEPGRHEIGNCGTFAIVQDYQTKDESQGFIECHRKYIDVQYVASGIEKAGVAAKSACSEKTSYDKEKDFQKLSGKVDFITLSPEVFAIFFPQDGHMPCITAGRKRSNVRKIVFKIPC